MNARLGTLAAVLALTVAVTTLAAPPPAKAVNVAKPICTLAGLVSGIAGKVCSAASHAGSVLKAGKKLLGGHLGGALQALSGASTAAKALTAGAVLASIVVWVSGGAKFVLQETAKVISTTTRPQLQSTWFSASYWRMAGISALLTLPFLFAASIQALMRSDLTMLARSALGYLPLGMLCVAIAAPLTALLLSASDEMSAIISGAAGGAGETFLTHVSFLSGGLSAISGSTFVMLFVGLLTVAATVTLWVELLVRAAAVYVVVLMLPLFFAALVWPARRIWAIRSIELLIALILSKFVIVAVLSLGGAALSHTAVPSFTQALGGTTLVMLAAFSPWALVRLLPLHELAGGLEGLRNRSQAMLSPVRAQGATEIAQELVRQLPAELPARSATPDEPGAAAAAVGGLAGDNGSGGRGDDGSGGRGGDGSGGREDALDDEGLPRAGAAPAAGGEDAPPAPSDTGVPPAAAGSRGASAPQSEDRSSRDPTRAEALSEMEPHWRAPNGAWGMVDLTAEGLASEPPWIKDEPGPRQPDDSERATPPDEQGLSEPAAPPDGPDPLPAPPDPEL